MKINLILPHQLPFPPKRGGGVEYLNWLLALEFAKRGHQVVAYSRTGVGLLERELGIGGIQHIRVPARERHPNRGIDHLFGLCYARRLLTALECADVSTFHTPFSFLLSRRKGLGVCTHTIHRTPKWPLPLYRGLDRVYCGSNAVVEQARQVDRSIANLKRVYNCVTCKSALQVAAADKTEERSGLLFLYVGRFVADKGLESLVKGFEQSLREDPNNRLKTVGPLTAEGGSDVRLFRRISQYIKDQGLNSSIEFLPPIFERVELEKLISAADVICVPSLGGETFSMAVLEAMALAKPVLVSDFSPMPEAVDHGTSGFVARAGDAASIAEGMRFFSANRSKLRAIGENGFEKARKCFSVERIAGEYLADFENLIALRQRRGKARSTQGGT